MPSAFATNCALPYATENEFAQILTHFSVNDCDPSAVLDFALGTAREFDGKFFQPAACGPINSYRQLPVKCQYKGNMIGELNYICGLTFRCNQIDVLINWIMYAENTLRI